MSLIPLLSELLEDYSSRPRHVYDQHFGMGLLDDDILSVPQILSVPLRSGYIRPWRNFSAGDSGVSTVQSNDREFKVNLDVQQFKPEELKVKLSDDGFLVVEGKHEERSDQHGFISRQFTRRYKLPSDVKTETLSSNLSSDGVLSLTAEKAQPKSESGKEIKITMTNKPAIKKKTQEKAGEKMEE